MHIEKKVQEALNEIRPFLQADGGDVELVEVRADTAFVRLKGACSGCPSATATLKNVVEEKIRERVPAIQKVLETGGEAGGHAAAPDPFENRRALPGVGSIIAVASGKGGVGKSTVAVNLAVALARSGLKTGLLDADIYGPSIPTMMGITEQPELGPEGIEPIERHGVRVISIGFFIDTEQPVIWRGPMIMKAVDQLLHEVHWGELDVLVVDLPPGTGDAQLTLVQSVPVDGGLIVTTSSEVALIDARRAVGMFEEVEVPVLGIVENMGRYACPHCGEHSDLFAHGGAEEVARNHRVPFLGSIPFDPAIGRGGDAGRPVVSDEPESARARAFTEVADRVSERVRTPARASAEVTA